MDGPALSLAARSCGLHGFYWKEHMDVFDRHSYINMGCLHFLAPWTKRLVEILKHHVPSWYGSFEQSNDYSSISDDCGSTYFEKHKRWNIMFNFIAVWWDQILQASFFPKVRYTLHTLWCCLLENRNDPLARCRKWVHIYNELRFWSSLIRNIGI